jgi:hypothetical protein
MFGCVLFAGLSSGFDLQVYEGEKMQFNKRDTQFQPFVSAQSHYFSMSEKKKKKSLFQHAVTACKKNFTVSACCTSENFTVSACCNNM